MTVGIFNNRKLIINLRFELPSCSKLSNNLSNYDPNYISLLFYIFLIAFLFSKGYVLKISTKLHISIFLLFNILLAVLVWLYRCLIILSGDVEVNPGPKNSVSECLSICHWNLNSTSVHDYSKLFLLKVYISVHKFDIICLSETYLDSTVPLDDDNLVIFGYNLIYSDHPSNTKRGGVCLYYKNYLPLRVLNISYLKECVNFELKIGDKSCTLSGKILSGKIFVEEIFRRGKFLSLVKNFVTFPRRKFSPRVKNRVYRVYLFAIRVRYNYRYFS